MLCSDKKLVATGCAPAVFSSLAKTRRKEAVHTVDLFFFSDLALTALPSVSHSVLTTEYTGSQWIWQGCSSYLIAPKLHPVQAYLATACTSPVNHEGCSCFFPL